MKKINYEGKNIRQLFRSRFSTPTDLFIISAKQNLEFVPKHRVSSMKIILIS